MVRNIEDEFKATMQSKLLCSASALCRQPSNFWKLPADLLPKKCKHC